MTRAVAWSALFLALAGGAYAAVELGRNSVKSRNIAPGQVKAGDLGPRAVTPAKLGAQPMIDVRRFGSQELSPDEKVVWDDLGPVKGFDIGDDGELTVEVAGTYETHLDLSITGGELAIRVNGQNVQTRSTGAGQRAQIHTLLELARGDTVSVANPEGLTSTVPSGSSLRPSVELVLTRLGPAGGSTPVR
ncbi:hypothetical protein HJD18_07200 [Thermoleophilia bacterium SCSIO 60948]|nr:hypothetical protein HJD18_07200 [Thermoleophilia bacterium SCSIO 60948]